MRVGSTDVKPRLDAAPNALAISRVAPFTTHLKYRNGKKENLFSAKKKDLIIGLTLAALPFAGTSRYSKIMERISGNRFPTVVLAAFLSARSRLRSLAAAAAAAWPARRLRLQQTAPFVAVLLDFAAATTTLEIVRIGLEGDVAAASQQQPR